MSSQFPGKRLNRSIRNFCGQQGEEDGLDPRRYFRRGRNRKEHRKDLQLCEQVAHTLQYVLSGATGDDVLRDLAVVRVVPAPNSARLLVLVAAAGHQPVASADDIAARLAVIKPRLRAEVAASITRRKAPDLVFQVVAADAPHANTEREGGPA